MKALIHIGIPKSGTSSIQAFLALNRARLARQGVLYAPFTPGFGSQFEFAVTALQACGQTIAPELERRRLGLHSIYDQQAYTARYAQFLDTILQHADARLFLGSSEHLQAWLRAPRQIAALDSFLRARFVQVDYLVYLRRPEELVISSYSEAVRRGATHDLTTHLARHGTVAHWNALKPWVQVVGAGRLTVRLVCPDALHGGDLLTDFATQAGIALPGMERPGLINTALSASEIALRRRLNGILPVLGRHGGLHWSYRAALRVLGPVLARSQQRLNLTVAQRADIRARNAAENARVCKKLCPAFKTLI